jgi:hypothetical protein
MHARIDSVLAVQSDLLDRLAEEVVQGQTDVQQAARALSHRDMVDGDLALD